MKKLLRVFVVETFSLYLVAGVAAGMLFEKGVGTLLFAGFGLAVASFIVKPVINLLLLPINLITFGLFRWVSSAIALYLVTLVVLEFRIERFAFAGFTSTLFDLPAILLDGAGAFIAFSFLLSFITGVIYWIIS